MSPQYETVSHDVNGTIRFHSTVFRVSCSTATEWHHFRWSSHPDLVSLQLATVLALASCEVSNTTPFWGNKVQGSELALRTHCLYAIVAFFSCDGCVWGASIHHLMGFILPTCFHCPALLCHHGGVAFISWCRTSLTEILWVRLKVSVMSYGAIASMWSTYMCCVPITVRSQQTYINFHK